MRFVSAKHLGKQTCSANILMGGSFEGISRCLEYNTYATAQFIWGYSILTLTINIINRSELITAVNMCKNLLHGKDIS